MARHHSEVGKSAADKQLYLLKRWAGTPQYSPLSAIPNDELSDLYYGRKEEEDEENKTEEEGKVEEEGEETDGNEAGSRRFEIRNRRMASLIEVVVS